jgi:hypothetical protein
LPEDELKEPDAVTFKGNPKIIAYVQQMPALKEEIEGILAKEDCIICWPKSNGQSLELKFKKESGKQKPPKNWSSTCCSILTNFFR